MRKLLIGFLVAMSGMLYGNQIVINSSYARAGEDIAIPVIFSNDSIVAGIQLDIRFDSSLMEFDTITSGDILDTTFSVAYSADSNHIIILIYSIRGDTILPDSGDLLNLIFSTSSGAQSGDTAIITFSKVKVVDTNIDSIPFTMNNGYVIIDNEPPSLIDLVSPYNNSYSNNDTIVFEWHGAVDEISGVAGYWLEVSEDSTNFEDSVYVGDTTYTMILNDTTYYWRVKAVDNAGNEGEWSEVWSFTVDTQVPEVPTLISPIGGEWSTNTMVNLEWSEVGKSVPVRYVVEVMNGGASVMTDTVDTAGLMVNLSEGRYTWRVKAFDLAGNESGWSSVDSFGVDVTPPEPVGLVSPAESAMLNTSSILFDWSDGVDTTSGVAGYWIEVSTEGSFAGVESIFVSESETTMVLSDTTWYWRVKVVDNAGLESEWSEVRTFTIDTGVPDTPTLESPIGGVWLRDTVVGFEWSGVSKKVKGDNELKATPVRYVLEVDGSVVDTVDTNYYEMMMGEGIHTWRVKAFDLAGNESNWSNIDSFEVDVSVPGAPELALPLNGVYLNNDTIVFVWHGAVDEISGVAGYWLEVSEDSTSFGDSMYVEDTTYTMVLGDTTYYWRVKAVDNASNEGNWSEVWSFTVDTQVPEVPALISPIGGEWLTDTMVTLEWSGVGKSAPVRYVVEIMKGGTGVVTDTVDTPGLMVNLSEGRYTWRVKAFDLAGNESDWTPVDSFGLDVTPPEPVSLISPFDSAMLNTSRISFDWSDGIDSTSGVAGYWIEVSTEESFAGVESSFVSVSETTMVLSDTTWYWRVKAVDNAGNEGNWSEVWQFTVDTQVPEAPQLMSPIGNVWLDNDTVTFVWSKVSLKTVKDEKSTPVMYMLEVDGNAVDTAITDTTYTLVVEEGNHSWRVRAYDLAGNISQWSNMGQFGVDTSAPVIDSLTTIMDTVRSVGPWAINAWAEDAYSGVDNAQLIYQIDTGWDTVAMSDSGNGRWVGEIPAITDSLAHDIRYYVEVTDSVGNSTISDTISFVAIEVEEGGSRGFVELIIPSIVAKQGMEIRYSVPGRKEFTVRMYDISGREIWRENLELSGRGTKRLNVKMTEGVYFIYIEGAGKVFRRRLIVIGQ